MMGPEMLWLEVEVGGSFKDVCGGAGGDGVGGWKDRRREWLLLYLADL
jgi:hypothetical protein